MQGRDHDSPLKSGRSFAQRIATLAVWVVVALCAFGTAHAEQKVYFDIPSGPARDTLPQYISQTGLSVIFPTVEVGAIVTNAVHGEYDVAAALERMTQGTRLRYEFIDADAVTVTLASPRSARKDTMERAAPAGEGPPAVDRRSLFSQIETITVSSSVNRPTANQIASEMITLNRADIEAFGFTTVQDVMRTLPQIFGGGPSEDTRIGFEAGTNAGIGAGVNLRGLGAGSTLVLVNGRRMAGGGSEGIFTDTMSLPLALIERIEILPDSSSSVYGADAVGGVVNFVLMNKLDGARTEASFGASTRDELDQNHVAQIMGVNTRFFDGLFGVDYYARDNLPTADRNQAQSDLRGLGGDNFDTFASNPATIIFGGQSFAVPRGQDGTNLTIADLVPNDRNLANRYGGADLLPSQQRWSLYGTGKKSLSDSVQIFLDALVSQRDLRDFISGVKTPILVPATNPFNPFTHSGVPAPIQVGYDFSRDLGRGLIDAQVRTLNVILGVDTLAGKWHITTTGDFATEHLRSDLENTLNSTALFAALADTNPATAFNPFGDGSYTNPATIEGIRSTSTIGARSRLWTANITGSRELMGLGGGRGKLVAGADYRDQELESFQSPSSTFNSTHDLSRKVSALFTAVSLPIIGKRTDESGPNRLEVSLAGRYENYSDFGHIITPRMGVTYSPLESVSFRGTWSKSFRPPNLVDLDDSGNLNALIGVVNPAAPGGQSLVLARTGKNSQLREERAESWTVGLDWDVTPVPGLSAAMTYFHTTFKDRMNVPLPTAALLTDPALADLLIRDPTPEQRQAVCDIAPLFNGSPAACMSLPITGLVDLRVRNSALMRTDGIDLLGEYRRYIGKNALTFRLDGTYVLSFSDSQSRNLPLTERVSTQNNPIDLRLRGTLGWQRGPFRTSALLTYFDDYRDTISIPNRRVDSWTTLNLNFAYTTESTRASPLATMTISLDAENVFDELPPFLNNPIGMGYDQENGELTGRIVSLSVRKNW